MHGHIPRIDVKSQTLHDIRIDQWWHTIDGGRNHPDGGMQMVECGWLNLHGAEEVRW
jgi:hypothetical protein